MRLTPRQHLRRTAEFEAVRTAGLRVDVAPFRLQLRLTEGVLRRVGVIASRRTGGAVQRNRAKRLLREAFRLHQDLLPPGCDVVLIARASILTLSGAQVQGVFRNVVERLARRIVQQSHA